MGGACHRSWTFCLYSSSGYQAICILSLRSNFLKKISAKNSSPRQSKNYVKAAAALERNTEIIITKRTGSLSRAGDGHKIGGYPFFTQCDPRDSQKRYVGHDIPLLQIDSEDDHVG